MQRPCLTLFIAFSIVIAADHYLLFAPPLWLAAGAVVWLLCLLLKRVGRYDATCLLLLVALVGGVRSSVIARAHPAHHISHFVDREEAVLLSGTVSSDVENRETGGRFSVSITQVAVADTVFRAAGGVLVNCKRFVPKVSFGDRVRLRVMLDTPQPVRNPGAFDYAAYLKRKGLFRRGRIARGSDLEILDSATVSPASLVIAPIRSHVRQIIRQNLSGGPAALVEGVLLGDKSALPDAIRENFSRAGVSHVLAVSGLHVGLVAVGAFFCVRSFGGGAKAGSIGTTLAVWLYAVVTGLPASVVRAATVATLVVWARSGQRQIDGLNALGAAGLVLLAFRPLDIMDLGFQLSFAATSGILLLHRPFTDILAFRGGRKWRAWAAAPLAVSVAAQVTTAPLIISAFGQISLIATLANIAVIPLMSGAVGVGLVTVIVGLVTPDGATVLNGANWLLLKSALWFAKTCATPDWASVDCLNPPTPIIIAVGCGLLALTEPIRRSRLTGSVLIVWLLLANVSVWRVGGGDQDLVVRVLDVGQGDGVLVSFPNGKHILVDGGVAGYGEDAGERVILPALRHLGIRRLEAVIASHPHADHVGGLVSVLEQVEVGHYVDSGQYYSSSTALRIRNLIRAKGIAHHIVAAGDSIMGFGRVGLSVLHPRSEFVNEGGEAPDGLNNGSVVVRMDYEGQSVLFTGDIEHETDRALLAWGTRLKASILKAAHHGSRTSSTPAFLDAVSPEWVAVSCGIDNKFRHPAPEVMARYKNVGAISDRTDLSGCLTYRIRDSGVEMRRYLGRYLGR